MKNRISIYLKAKLDQADGMAIEPILSNAEGLEIIAALEATRPEVVSLTEQERAALTLLADAWNSWCLLPARVDGDDLEMQDTIHRAQALLALRVARRADPMFWR